ncbi:MAG: hypothetical protein GF344_09830 [Chitinivibrionales bacterium]|nr:hypothetical protein [Chitinivibrionales bacterium]MBD3357139.1 hypothetical protein [Chitinivibrionales bacterium]
MDLNVGNVKVRKDLGATVPVEIFRILRLHGFEPLFGKSSNAITMSCGRDLGLKIGSAIMIEHPTLESYVNNVVAFFAENNIGLVSLRPEGSEFIVQVDECVSCAGVTNIGKCICGFEGGIISGIFQAFFAGSFYVKEMKCWANGDTTCEFLVKDLKEM